MTDEQLLDEARERCLEFLSDTQSLDIEQVAKLGEQFNRSMWDRLMVTPVNDPNSSVLLAQAQGVNNFIRFLRDSDRESRIFLAEHGD